jgi:cyclohexyl-isocyanide hydratase
LSTPIRQPELHVILHDTHLLIGSLIFDGMDQFDLTGPFEVLSRVPNSTYRIYARTASPIRDLNGLRLIPDATLAEAPPLDVLHVPGGPGQEALMEDQEVIAWIQKQAAGARAIFSVCTGALLCGAAGLLRGRRATTHWSSLHLLPFFGAIPVNERVVMDANYIFAAGVTAGIDGALRLAAELRGDEVARAIQLDMAYAPEPPFNSGTPESAPPSIVEQARRSYRQITAQREETAPADRGSFGPRRPHLSRLAKTEALLAIRPRQLALDCFHVEPPVLNANRRTTRESTWTQQT